MRTRHPVLIITVILILILISCNAEIERIITGEYSYYEEYYYKTPQALDERSVERYIEKVQAMYDMYLNDDINVYVTVIPNKSLYIEEGVAEEYYNKIVNALRNNLTAAEYIELSDTLKLESYYKTDDHWRQEMLGDTVYRLGDKMGFVIDFTKFTEQKFGNFIGMYNSQIDDLHPETLIFMTSEYTINAHVDNFVDAELTDIYDLHRLYTHNIYDIFLSGVSPIITITNEHAENDRELIIFRDSFASSLTPLLLEAYSKITLIDSRFIMMDIIGDYVEFTNQDVIFMYSDLIINNSLLLK